MELKRIILITAWALAASACAHDPTDARLDRKVAAEKTVPNMTALRTESDELFASMPDLNVDQRSQLSALRIATRQSDSQMRETALKLRSVLIKDLVATNYDPKEVVAIKDRITALEGKRLALLFDSVAKANQILGHTSSARQRAMENFFEFHEVRAE